MRILGAFAVAAAVAAVLLGASGQVLADHRHHGFVYWNPGPVVYYSPPVVYARPTVVYSAPVVYARPTVVYSAPVYSPPPVVYGPPPVVYGSPPVVYSTPTYVTTYPAYAPVYTPVYGPAYRPYYYYRPGFSFSFGSRW